MVKMFGQRTIRYIHNGSREILGYSTHELLKSKLSQYGKVGRTLNWIDAFLCHRAKCVVVNGETSDWSQVDSGVPQGTVLGPVLFSLYINDMVEEIQSNIRLFAATMSATGQLKIMEICKGYKKILIN